MLQAYSPKGKEIIGSFDSIKGVALGTVQRKDRYAEAEIEYCGETKVWWDEQVQLYEDGERLWVDEDHLIWKTSQLMWVDLETGMTVPVVEDKNG
jgi:hypothetical protein